MSSGSKRLTGQEGLLLWLQTRTHGYEGVNVVDFTTSWENGLAFCALVHAFHPDKIAFKELKAENKTQNLKLAFDVGETVGIPALMDPEDMLLDCGPDRFSVVTYLSQFFHKFKDFHQNVVEEVVDKDEQVRKRREILDKAKPERKCHKCGESMSQGTIIEALGKNFHTACFVCTSCTKPFPNNKFMNVDGNPFCATCGRKAFGTAKNSNTAPPQTENPKCGKCGELCGGDTIDAVGQSWHPNCFVCVTCLKPFPSGKFINIDSKPYCEQCGRKAFVSSRLKAPLKPSTDLAPAQSPKPDNDTSPKLETKPTTNRSKSMISLSARPREETTQLEPPPKLNSVSGQAVSARISALQREEKNPPSPKELSNSSAQSRTASTPGPIHIDIERPESASPAPAPAVDKIDTEERKLKRNEEEAKKRREMEERETKRKEMEELEKLKKDELRKKREDEKLRKKLEEDEKKKKEAEEKEAKKKEEDELKKKKSEEKRKQMEEIKRKKDEEDAKKKKEQDEEEAKKKERAEAAKKKREEMKKIVEEEEAKKNEAKELEKRKRVAEQQPTPKSPDVTTLFLEPRAAPSRTAPYSATVEPANPSVNEPKFAGGGASASGAHTASTVTSVATGVVEFRPVGVGIGVGGIPTQTVAASTLSSSSVTDLKLASRAKDKPVEKVIQTTIDIDVSHISQSKNKCPAADVMCPWGGSESAVQVHTATCPYVALRPILSHLLKQNQEMITSLKELKQQNLGLKK